MEKKVKSKKRRPVISPLSDAPKGKVAAVKAILSDRKKALTMVIGNQKGGVKKTTNTYMIAYTLARWGFYTLVVDLDPQSNITRTLMLTKSRESKDITTIDKTLMRGVQEGYLDGLPVRIMDNLDLLPSFVDFQYFAKFLYRTTSSEYEETHALDPLFKKLKKRYDFILFDVPPQNVEVTQNAIVTSDYVLIAMETQQDSYSGVLSYVKALAKLKQQYDLPVEVLGILPVLTEHRDKRLADGGLDPLDKRVIQAAEDTYGVDNVFTPIPYIKRVKRFPFSGISVADSYDRRAHLKYEPVVRSIFDRIIYFER